MRLSARDVEPVVSVSLDTSRPIRLRAAGLLFALETNDALNLANQLADAVATVTQHGRRQS